MTKFLATAMFVSAFLACGPTYAQNGLAAYPPQPPIPTGEGLLNRNNITSTGATVPHPGAPSGELEPLFTGRSIYDENDRPLQSICKNC